MKIEDEEKEFARMMMEDGVPSESLTGAAAETAEEKATREKAESEAGNETEETAEEKAAREKAESEAGNETEETAEEKATREKAESEAEDKTEETAEEKAAREKAEDPDRKKLSPELQAVFDKRIGKEVAKTKTAQEQAEAARTQARELETELTDLRTEVQELRRGSTAAATGVSPAFLAETTQELDAREDYLWRVTKFCRQHAAGVEGDGTEKNPSYTAEEVEAKLLQVEEERARIIPRAREMLRQRLALQETVRKVYPDLLDAKTPASQEAERILRAHPSLRMRPDVKLLLGDMLAGRKARTGKAAEKGKPASRVAPAVPAGNKGGGHRKPVTEPTGPKKDRLAIAAEGDFSDEALARALD